MAKTITEFPIQKLLTEREASTYTSIAMSTLQKSRSTGYIAVGVPAPRWRKINTMVRYHIDTLDEWIEAQSEEGLPLSLAA